MSLDARSYGHPQMWVHDSRDLYQKYEVLRISMVYLASWLDTTTTAVSTTSRMSSSSGDIHDSTKGHKSFCKASSWWQVNCTVDCASYSSTPMLQHHGGIHGNNSVQAMSASAAVCVLHRSRLCHLSGGIQRLVAVIIIDEACSR